MLPFNYTSFRSYQRGTLAFGTKYISRAGANRFARKTQTLKSVKNKYIINDFVFLSCCCIWRFFRRGDGDAGRGNIYGNNFLLSTLHDAKNRCLSPQKHAPLYLTRCFLCFYFIFVFLLHYLKRNYLAKCMYRRSEVPQRQ